MYTLLKTGLLVFFRESDLPSGVVSEAHLSELFEKFIEELIDYSSDEHRSIIERLRCMNFTHKQLSLLEEQKHTAEEHLITDYMIRTLFLIDMEIRSLNLRLQYPPIRHCAEGKNRISVISFQRVDSNGCDGVVVCTAFDRSVS